jgi:hypothetical protein
MRNAIVAVVVSGALLHWGCCDCADQPTTPATPVAVVTPTPAPSASAAGCTLPAVNADRPICRPEPPARFEADVVRAQAEVRRDHPELFDGQGKIINPALYSGWVATTLKSYGLCAAAVGGDGTDEVGVKNTNDWNEQYDIVTGGRDPWTAYMVTCRPPLF